uniref:Uncharacterized protein n=1 Tax=Rhodnius prolixus TaxID=13249 RepID=T1HR24_RHOPR
MADMMDVFRRFAKVMTRMEQQCAVMDSKLQERRELEEVVRELSPRTALEKIGEELEAVNKKIDDMRGSGALGASCLMSGVVSGGLSEMVFSGARGWGILPSIAGSGRMFAAIARSLGIE